MIGAVFTLGAVLAISYVVADKEKIPEYTREMNRIAWPLLIVSAAVFGLLVFG